MSEYWYTNPRILFDKYNEFIPYKNLSRVDKINAIARLAIYLFLFIIVGKINKKWLSVPIIILLITCFLGVSERFTSIDPKIDPEACTKPTRNNPFMNFTYGDLVTVPDRLGACTYEASKKEMRQEFNKHTHIDTSDIWGRHISDRQFYTMPNTNIVNNQTEFAQWIFGNSGECKTTGKDCLKIADTRYHRGRITIAN
jgi:hypothetical protein